MVIKLWGRPRLQAVKKALKEREDALLTHYSIGQDLEKKKSMIAALQEQEQKTFGVDKNKTRKVGWGPAQRRERKGKEGSGMKPWVTYHSRDSQVHAPCSSMITPEPCGPDLGVILAFSF
jgi:hypothetical protein